MGVGHLIEVDQELLQLLHFVVHVMSIYSNTNMSEGLRLLLHIKTPYH